MTHPDASRSLPRLDRLPDLAPRECGLAFEHYTVGTAKVAFFTDIAGNRHLEVSWTRIWSIR
jgi:hypothetical protein